MRAVVAGTLGVDPGSGAETTGFAKPNSVVANSANARASLVGNTNQRPGLLAQGRHRAEADGPVATAPKRIGIR